MVLLTKKPLKSGSEKWQIASLINNQMNPFFNINTTNQGQKKSLKFMVDHWVIYSWFGSDVFNFMVKEKKILTFIKDHDLSTLITR